MNASRASIRRRETLEQHVPAYARTGHRGPPQLVTVLMPVRNGERTIAQQLKALSVQTYRGEWEMLVVDNGSTDNTRQIVGSFSGRLPQLRIVDASDRPGINRARNAGAAAAKGQYLVHCDADDIATPDWLNALVGAAPSYDIVGGCLEHDALNASNTRTWRGRTAEKGLPELMDFLPYAVGANIALWTEVLRTIGGWNESYLFGCDDVELCWRAQLAGYRIGFAAEAIMLYRHRSDVWAMARQIYSYSLAQVQLYRDFHAAGAPPRRVSWALRDWMSLVLHLPDLFRSELARGLWHRTAAFRYGRLRGSLRYRVLCP